MEILRNGLGGADERVSGVTFDGQSIGACNPDGDYHRSKAGINVVTSFDNSMHRW